jgi:hypothetical protein
MSNHLKYKDPILSNQQAASATQLLQNDGNSKSKYLYSIKYIIPYKKKYTSQNVKGRHAKQISVM